MPLPTAVISNGFKFKVGSVDHECDITGFEEVVTSSGGEEIRTACGSLRTPVNSTITGVRVTFVQNLAAAGLFMYLRDNTSAGTEAIRYGGTNVATESATNPYYDATASGWTKPPMTTQAAGGYPTVTVEFTFTAPPVKDVTP